MNVVHIGNIIRVQHITENISCWLNTFKILELLTNKNSHLTFDLTSYLGFLDQGGYQKRDYSLQNTIWDHAIVNIGVVHIWFMWNILLGWPLSKILTFFNCQYQQTCLILSVTMVTITNKQIFVSSVWVFFISLCVFKVSLCVL